MKQISWKDISGQTKNFVAADVAVGLCRASRVNALLLIIEYGAVGPLGSLSLLADMVNKVELRENPKTKMHVPKIVSQN